MEVLQDVSVWRFDRLGRAAKGLRALFDELRQAGVILVSLCDGIDLSTPAGRLMANVLASVAAYETEIRRGRTTAGQLAALAACKRWGGRRPGTLVTVKPKQIAIVQRLAEEGIIA